jgi:hypothetical protein
MKLKQKTVRLAMLVAALSLAAPLLIPATTFALTKNEFLSVLCDSLEGPNAKDNCYKSGKDGVVTNYSGQTFKLTDYKDLSKAEFRKEVEKKLGVDTTPPKPAEDATSCENLKTAIIKINCKDDGTLQNNGIWQLLLLVINILTAGVGVLAVGGIVYGAILYTTAEDKADQVKKATDIITNVIIGLVLFALMWAGLNFLVPGGVFAG